MTITCHRCTAPAVAEVRGGRGPWVAACDAHLEAVQRTAGVPRETRLVDRDQDDGQDALW